MKQICGYVVIEKQKLLVLIRSKKYSRTLKLRFSGLDGSFFEDESMFLSSPANKNIFTKLLDGEVIDI